MQVTFSDLADEPSPQLLPPLDQAVVDESVLTPAQAAWRRDGVLILPRFLPDHLLDAYSRRRARELDTPDGLGWQSGTAYLQTQEMTDLALYPPLMAQMQELISEPLMLHLSLAGLVSTERDWHQDDYLNPPFVNGWYAAAWMALDDIHPDSGPFQYVPGSHRWPLMRGEKVRAQMPWREARQPTWPRVSEAFVVPAVDAEIIRRGAEIRSFIAKRGDVLIWHGRLLHRGSKPKQPGLPRQSLICHYSGISHRKDKRVRALDANGQVYWVAKRRGPVRRGLHALKVLKEQITARL